MLAELKRAAVSVLVCAVPKAGVPDDPVPPLVKVKEGAKPAAVVMSVGVALISVGMETKGLAAMAALLSIPRG